MNCICCQQHFDFRWTDTHGIGVCIHCGMPYRIYHYEGTERVDKPPECMIEADWLPICVRYWNETKRKVVPGCFDLGILGHRQSTYSGATEADFQHWDQWCELHAAQLPQAVK